MRKKTVGFGFLWEVSPALRGNGFVLDGIDGGPEIGFVWDGVLRVGFAFSGVKVGARTRSMS